MSFDQVAKEVKADSPKILSAATAAFTIAETGGGLRIGVRSAEAGANGENVGKRVPPYEFLCKSKTSVDEYDLVITFSQTDAGWTFSIRARQKTD